MRKQEEKAAEANKNSSTANVINISHIYSEKEKKDE